MQSEADGANLPIQLLLRVFVGNGTAARFIAGDS